MASDFRALPPFDDLRYVRSRSNRETSAVSNFHPSATNFCFHNELSRVRSLHALETLEHSRRESGGRYANTRDVSSGGRCHIGSRCNRGLNMSTIAATEEVRKVCNI